MTPALFSTYNCARLLGLTPWEFAEMLARAEGDGVRVYKVGSVHSVEPAPFLVWRERQP